VFTLFVNHSSEYRHENEYPSFEGVHNVIILPLHSLSQSIAITAPVHPSGWMVTF
jgi:hypothetical protein